MSELKICIAAGGSGGHIIPAIAVAEALRDEDSSPEVFFIGTGSDLEKRLVEEAGWTHYVIPFVAVSGGGVKGFVRFLFALPKALLRAFSLYRKLRPAAVIGFGGFPSFVPMFAAWIMGIPSVLHEQNVQVGLANKVLSFFAERVFAVHRASGFWSGDDVEYLSNPVRQVFENIPDWKAPEAHSGGTILVVGGSQGAVSLNDAVLELSPVLKNLGVTLIHQSGAVDFERVHAHYQKEDFAAADVREFIDDIAACYREAHLVICRAGAMTVAEVSAAGRPAIFVPLRIAGGHQAENVVNLVKCGGALVLAQGPELSSLLGKIITELWQNPEKLKQLAHNARQASLDDGGTSSKRIAQTVLQVRRGRTKKKRTKERNSKEEEK